MGNKKPVSCSFQALAQAEKFKILILLGSSALLLFFQNCSGGGYTSSAGLSSTIPNGPNNGTGNEPAAPFRPPTLPGGPVVIVPDSPDDSGVSPQAPSGPMGLALSARLLTQGAMGHNYEDIEATSKLSYSDWFNRQFNAPVSQIRPFFNTQAMQARTPAPNYNGVSSGFVRRFWLYNALTGQDQLRQRVAYALSEIFVVSLQTLGNNVDVVSTSGYYDLLAQNAFVNYRKLIEEVTLSVPMGIYLSMAGSDGVNLPAGAHPDENYAREIMQLFSVGLYQLNIDGTEKLDANGNKIPTYSQTDVENLARALTGWGSYYNDNDWQGANVGAMKRIDQATFLPVKMRGYLSRHDRTAKRIIGGVNIPAGLTPETELKIVLDTLHNHPNVGPFMAKQLIQRLVTSNPRPSYVQRVAQVFNNNGQGVRGDMAAVVRAILTDNEALNGFATNPQYGKLRESPLTYVHLLKAFYGTTNFINTINPIGVLDFDKLVLYWVIEPITVFNYFRPDYLRPGNLAANKLFAPEFQLVTENSVVEMVRGLNIAAGSYRGSFTNNQVRLPNLSQHDGFSPYLNLTPWEPFASNSTALVDRMNLVLMNGQMEANMKSALISYANTVSNLNQRVADLASLIINSPQYSIQR